MRFAFDPYKAERLMSEGPPAGKEALIRKDVIVIVPAGEASSYASKEPAYLVTGGRGSPVRVQNMTEIPAENKPDLMFRPAIDKQGEHRKETRVQTKFSPNVKLGRGVRPRGFALGRVVK